MYKSDYIITSKHYLILSVIAFAAGILLTASINGDVLFAVTVFLAVLFCVLGGLILANRLGKKASKTRLKHILLPFLLIFFMLMGILRIFAAEIISPGVLKNYTGQEVWLSGTVASPVTESSSGFSCYFNFEVVQIESENIKPETIVMYLPKSRGSLLSEGDKICCWTKLSSPERDDLYDSFDYYTYLRGKNIFLTGNTKNANPITLKTPLTLVSAIKDFGAFIKAKTVEAVDALIPESSKHSAILKGILMGDKTGFSDNLYKKFSNAGLSHIVAVSGMHLSILFAVLTLLLYKIHTHKKLAYLLSVPVIIVLTSAAGFTPSVCRSAIMLIMMIAAMLLAKRYTPINALFLSLGIILTASPYALFSKSLILSFGATFGIIVFFGPLFKFLKSISSGLKTSSTHLNEVFAKITDFVGSSVVISTSAFIGTAFASAFFFGTVSFIQVLTNLWIIPTATAVFCMGFLACIMYYIFPHFTIALFYYPLRICIAIISKTANIFGADKFAFHIQPESVSPVYFFIYIGFVLFLYLLLKFFADLKKDKAVNS